MGLSNDPPRLSRYRFVVSGCAHQSSTFAASSWFSDFENPIKNSPPGHAARILSFGKKVVPNGNSVPPSTRVFNSQLPAHIRAVTPVLKRGPPSVLPGQEEVGTSFASMSPRK